MPPTILNKSLKLSALTAFALACLAASAPPSQANECHFGREACHGEMHDRVWIETFDLTQLDGKPTTFHGGDTIARISQEANGYAGYRLKRVGFLVARDSFAKPRIAVFVNDQKRGEREVNSKGNVLTGFNTEPVAIDVDECPLDFYAIVQKGTVQAYAVNFYWEAPRDEWGSEFSTGGPGNIVVGKAEDSYELPDSRRTDLVGIAQNLAANVERLEGDMTYPQFMATAEPMLGPARKFMADVKACGAICAQDTAYELLNAEEKCDSTLNDLLTVPRAGKTAAAILTDVKRLQNYYGTTAQ